MGVYPPTFLPNSVKQTVTVSGTSSHNSWNFMVSKLFYDARYRRWVDLSCLGKKNWLSRVVYYGEVMILDYGNSGRGVEWGGGLSIGGE